MIRPCEGLGAAVVHERASERKNEESVEGRDFNRGCEIPSFSSLPNWVWNLWSSYLLPHSLEHVYVVFSTSQMLYVSVCFCP